ncbi:hypothetical protein JCM9140_148 [Halalkalibacter wakoensis JCM 9140]|uniref:Uncharacterized protein n=1 Tax=Halalkalibacter wakoensis JCM 9140 TaxID=1236970 RepID=W4PWJ9_9BACI|nr:hypothetical protein [Halalkalibacter wakoensis]GAE24236.1 hypothetical protein JCM9140_148 [Halalkalibacter wakoensis JCM 9140]
MEKKRQSNRNEFQRSNTKEEYGNEFGIHHSVQEMDAKYVAAKRLNRKKEEEKKEKKVKAKEEKNNFDT